MMRPDLHMHSTFSDGTCTPYELARRCQQAEVTLFSVTDHDTMAGLFKILRHNRGDFLVVQAARTLHLPFHGMIEQEAVPDGRIILPCKPQSELHPEQVWVFTLGQQAARVICQVVAPAGKLPFLEPGLDDALLRHLGNRFIPIAADQLKEAVEESDCLYYCVGTPYGKDGQADLTYLFSAIDQTLEARPQDRYQVMVVKSTIPPSTTSGKIIPYLESKGIKVGEDVGVANNPEFLREGHCWDDFMNADRIVLGVSDERSADVLRKVYATVTEPVFCVSLNTGEFIKYLSNTLLATLISYSNEMSIVADTIDRISARAPAMP